MYRLRMRATALAAALLIGAVGVAQAQDSANEAFDRTLRRDVRGRVEIAGGPVTFGFELEGRGPHVALLMRPNDAELSSRWDGLSDAEKIAEFKARGENIHEFKMDTERFSWLDARIHREGTGNWEIESAVFENVDEATRRMAEVKEMMRGDGRGFHLHVRWNPEWEVYRANSAEIADWMTRAADAIYLRRLEIMKHALSMNTRWNKRYDQATIAQIEEAMRMGRGQHEKPRTIAWRPDFNNTYVDVEIRGLWTRVKDIDRVARALVRSFKNHAWGQSRLRDNFLPFEDRVNGRTFAELVEEAARANGRELDASERAIVENLSRHDSPWGREVSGFMTDNFTKNMLTPFLNWELEEGLDRSTRRKIQRLRGEFVSKVLDLVDKVKAGELGLDVNAASRRALVDRFGLSGADADKVIAAREAALAEGNRISSLTQNIEGVSEAGMEKLRSAPALDADATMRKARSSVKSWARSARLADRMMRTLLPAEGAERNATNNRLLELSDLDRERLTEIGVRGETAGLIDAIRAEGGPLNAEALRNPTGDREAALEEDIRTLLRETNIPLNENVQMPEGARWHELRGEVTGMQDGIKEAIRNAFPSFHWMRDVGAENLRITVTGEAEPRMNATVTNSSVGSEVTISNGLLDKIAEATSEMSAEEAKAFRAKAITLLALDAVDRATSMSLNVEGGARASGQFGAEVSREEARKLERIYERANIEAPRDLSNLAQGRNVRRGSGIIPEGAQNENGRRVRNRSRTGRRARR